MIYAILNETDTERVLSFSSQIFTLSKRWISFNIKSSLLDRLVKVLHPSLINDARWNCSFLPSWIRCNFSLRFEINSWTSKLVRQVTLLSITYEDERNVLSTKRSRFRSSEIPLNAFFCHNHYAACDAIALGLWGLGSSIRDKFTPSPAINSRSSRYWILAFAFVVKRVRLPRISPSPLPPLPSSLQLASSPLSRHLHTFSW